MYKIIIGNEKVEIIKIKDGYSVEQYVEDTYSQFKDLDVRWEKLIY